MKALKAKMTEAGKSAEEIKDFETKAGGFAKKIIGNFKDYEFYTGESMDPDAMCVSFSSSRSGVVWLTVYQGCPPQLPRGRHDTVRHCLEARPQGREGLRFLFCLYQKPPQNQALEPCSTPSKYAVFGIETRSRTMGSPHPP